MTDIETRVLRPHETALFRDTRLKALREAPYAFGGRYEDEAGHPPPWWRDLLSGNKNIVLFAFRGDEAAGMIFGFEREDGACGLGGMWVDPACRRMGVARMLVMGVLEWAGGRGLKKVSLWNAANNLGAGALYRALGFQPTGKTKPLESNAVVDVVEYEIILTPISRS